MSELGMKTCHMHSYAVLTCFDKCATNLCLCAHFALHSMFLYVVMFVKIKSIPHFLNMLPKKTTGS